MVKRKNSWVRNGIESRFTPTKGRRYRARFKIKDRPITGPWRGTQKEARKDHATMRAREEELPTGGLLTVGDAMAMVIENLRKRDRRPATIAAYADKFTILKETFRAGLPLHQIKPEHIDAYAQKRVKGYGSGETLRKPVSAATVRGELRHFNRCFTLAIRKGSIANNPIVAAKDDLPDPDKPRQDWFAMPELQRILRKSRKWKPTERLHPDRDARIIEFMALTGIRKREIAALRVGQVNLAKGVIEIHEGKRGHRDLHFDQIPGLKSVVTALLDGRDRFRARREDPLLPLTYHGIGSMLRRWAKRLKEPRLHPHAMRHTFLTDVAHRTGNVFAVMKLGGIKSMAIAMRYIHLAGVEPGRVEHVSAPPRASGTR